MLRWVDQGVVTEAQVRETCERMAGNVNTSMAYQTAAACLAPQSESGLTPTCTLSLWERAGVRALTEPTIPPNGAFGRRLSFRLDNEAVTYPSVECPQPNSRSPASKAC